MNNNAMSPREDPTKREDSRDNCLLALREQLWITTSKNYAKKSLILVKKKNATKKIILSMGQN